MAQPQPNQEELPQVLILRPPPVFTAFQHQFSTKFRLLKAYDSPLPTDLFLATHAQSVRAVLCSGGIPITADLLRHLPSLQVVVTDSAGVNNIDLPECQRRGISVANAGNVFSEDVADIAVGLLIDILRKITAADRFVNGRLWSTLGDYPLGSKAVDGSTLDQRYFWPRLLRVRFHFWRSSQKMRRPTPSRVICVDCSGLICPDFDCSWFRVSLKGRYDVLDRREFSSFPDGLPYSRSLPLFF